MKTKEVVELWEKNRKDGVVGPDFDFSTRDEPEDDGYYGFSKRPAIPFEEISLEYSSPDEVEYVYWAYNDARHYDYDNYYYIVRMKDGRYAAFSELSSGTCEMCSSASDDVAFAHTLEEILIFGIGDTERKFIGIELDV